MRGILIVSAQPQRFAEFSEYLKNTGKFGILQATSAQEAFAVLGTKTMTAVVLDSSLADDSGLACAGQLAKRYPLVNCALVSPLPPEEFHEATEGLGLFMQLPQAVSAAEAEKMVKILQSIDLLLSE